MTTTYRVERLAQIPALCEVWIARAYERGRSIGAAEAANEAGAVRALLRLYPAATRHARATCRESPCSACALDRRAELP